MLVGIPAVDSNGVTYYRVRSVYQGYREQIIRVSQPARPVPGKSPSLLFVLPVDTGVSTLSSTWSDGLEELRLLNIPDRFNMTLVAPSFNYEPWYGDNVINPLRRMESFIIHDLVPFGDTLVAGSESRRRYLIGFSKSGNGALFLILRNPHMFTAAAAWDCPAELNSISAFSALPKNFGNQAKYDLYGIPALIAQKADAFRGTNRLWIAGHEGVFTADMVKLHNRLCAASIPHTWVQGGPRVHAWRSGWLDEAVSDLDAQSSGHVISD